MGNIPLHAKAVPRLDVGAQTSNSSISDPGLFSPRDVELTALPPQAAPREHPPQTGNVVGIFWDYENVRVPGNKTTAGAVDAIRRLALEHGTVVEQRLYYDSRHETEQYTDRINLDMSGFTLVDCPKRNNVKETLDKKLIVDIMSFRIKLDNCCVVLITSDGDYAYALNILRGFGVKTVVKSRSSTSAPPLMAPPFSFVSLTRAGSACTPIGRRLLRAPRAARAGARPPPSTLPHRDAAAPQKRDATAPHPRVSIQ